MNCANHPDLSVSAYCQNCGKALCTQCVRSVAGVVYCEPCLAARLHGSGAAPGAGFGAATAAAGAAAPGWSAVQDPAGRPVVSAFSRGPSPVLAGLLGTIPGVGAMYNGQFVKALVHVLVFILLVAATNHFSLAGLLIAAWFFYQVFDAVQTAIARRDGLPLPDPFGLNDLGQRLGAPAVAPVYARPPVAYPVDPAVAGPGASPDPAAAATGVPYTQADYVAGAAIPPVAPTPYPVVYAGLPEPIGAIVLIAVGMLFLLSTLGVFEWEWVGRGWPVIIIVIGAALLFRRVRSTPRAGGSL